MRRRFRRSSAWTLILGLALGLQAPGSSAAPAGDIPGVPYTGARGIPETVSQIMARQRLADLGPAKPQRIMPEHDVDRSGLPQDPAAPTAPAWPPRLPGQPRIAGSSSPQTPGLGFTGATLADTAAFPPDSMGTVGPTQFVVFVNGRIRTFNKTTGVADGVINANPDVFFSSVMTPVTPPVVTTFTSDPQVRYDRLSGRWFLSIIDVPCTNAFCTTLAANRWLLAVSNAASGGTITGATVWTFFFFAGDATNFLDYPSLGVDANALYTGGNMFTGAGSFVGTNGYVVQKSSVLGTGPIFMTKFANLATGAAEGPFAPRGVDNYDPSSTEGYFIGVSVLAFSRLDIRRVSNPGSATPTISANLLLTVPTTSSQIPVAHLGNTGGNNGRLDSLDDRLFQAHIRNGRLWTAHNIGVDASGVGGGTATTKRMAVRWYELNGIRSTDNGGVPVVVQSGTVFDNAATVSTARQFWIPSVMVSGQGHAALGFSTAGTTFAADDATVGRLAGDTLGTTQTVAIYTATSSAYNPPSDPGGVAGRRWGDYSYTSLDPLDDMTMWSAQEFCDSTNSYGLRVVKLIAPPPATPSSTNQPGGVAAGQPSVSVVVTGTSASGSGFYDPGANLAAPALPFTHLSASVGGGVTVNSAMFNSPTQVTLDISTVGAVAGAQNVTITNPDGQSATGIGLLTITGAAPTATPTRTSTQTATRTPTATATLTSTPTRTATPTPTPIPPTATPTRTFTPTLTGSFTPTPTPDPGTTTPTPTRTPTPTPVPGTSTATPTPTPTPTPSMTPTLPGSPTPTPTPVSTYFTLAPCRLIDTRNPVGPLGGPALNNGVSRTFVLAGQCFIPANAIAVTVNIAVTQPTNGPGFLTIYPAGTPLPLFASINYNAGQTRSNNAILILGASGDIAVRVTQGAGTVHFVLDVTGYFQ